MTREEAHEAVDRVFGRIEQDGREALGMGLCVPHVGGREGVEHTTIETDYETLHHERCVTPLAGAVHALALAVDALAERTDFGKGGTGR